MSKKNIGTKSWAIYAGDSNEGKKRDRVYPKPKKPRNIVFGAVNNSKMPVDEADKGDTR